VRDIVAVARTQLATALRERITLFWFVLFPLFVLALFGFIFADIGERADLSFRVTVVNLDRGAARGNFGSDVLATLAGLATAAPGGEAPLLELRVPGEGADVRAFTDAELQALRVGRRDAVVVIPDGFSEALVAAVGSGSAAAAIEVHTSGGRTSSEMALRVIEQVLAGVDREILVQLGQFDAGRAVIVDQAEVGASDRTLAYIDFLVPGVVLMGFFVAGLFSVPGTILFGRENRVLRRYWVTPLSVPRFLAGFGLGHVALCALQFAGLWLLGRFAFGSQVDFFRPLALVYLALSAATFLAIGFLVAAVARTANAGMAIANIINMPLMFLGGLFFPTGTMPPVLRAIMLANPVSYLADGLRASVGVSVAAYSTAASLGVPCAWIVGCAVVASLRMKWDVGR